MAIRKVKTKSGQLRWEAYLTLSGRGSKSIRRRFKRRIEAEDFVRSFGHLNQNEPDPGAFDHVINSNKGTFKEEAQYWLEIQRANFSIKNYQRSKTIIEKLIPLIGEVPLSEFTPSFLYRLRNDLISKSGLKGRGGQRISNAALNRWVTLVTTVINFSVGQQRTPKNPSTGYQKLKEIRKEIDFWTLEESQKFLAYAHERYPPSSEKRWVYTVYFLALNTGLRAGEIWGLQAQDLGKDECISVERQWMEAQQVFTAPKSKKSRIVPCNPSLKAELQELIKSRGVGKEFGTILFNTKGRPFNHANFLHRHFKKDMEESGIRKIRFHDLRHTALTLMVSKGIDMRTVQEIAGHSDIKTTIQYVHLLGENVRKASSLFSINPL